MPDPKTPNPPNPQDNSLWSQIRYKVVPAAESAISDVGKIIEPILPETKTDDAALYTAIHDKPITQIESRPDDSALGKAVSTLRDWANFTEEGKAEHPAKAAVGQLADRLDSMLFGERTSLSPKAEGMKTGFLTNPVTSTLIGNAIDSEGQLAKEAEEAEGVKNLSSAAKATPEEQPLSLNHKETNYGGEIRLNQETKNRGMLKYTTNENSKTASVTGVHVDKELRGKGHGMAMYERAANELRNKGYTQLTSDLQGTDSYDAGKTWERLKKAHPEEIESIPSKAGSPGYRWNLSPKKSEFGKMIESPEYKKLIKDLDIEPEKSPKEVIEGEGLKYKGELTKGSGVHMFEHPEHPGKTAALDEKDITSANVRNHMRSKLKDFGIQALGNGNKENK